MQRRIPQLSSHSFSFRRCFPSHLPLPPPPPTHPSIISSSRTPFLIALLHCSTPLLSANQLQTAGWLMAGAYLSVSFSFILVSKLFPPTYHLLHCTTPLLSANQLQTCRWLMAGAATAAVRRAGAQHISS
ncbi:unnamed protein product, partial [Closterium sp. Naga37s-1]